MNNELINKNMKLAILIFSITIVLSSCRESNVNIDRPLTCEVLLYSVTFYTNDTHLFLDFNNNKYNFKRIQNSLPIVGKFSEIESITIKTLNEKNLLTIIFSKEFNAHYYGWNHYTFGNISNQCKTQLLEISNSRGIEFKEKLIRRNTGTEEKYRDRHFSKRPA
ncbi:hypothetical protein ACFODZ_17050 [Marinicella sediminis]|uniref:Lipoprotein n=1 Tax=Marinicella sediminis TaxID=1792834 RepID=A0ABV7JD07_9GAMM|nr:hypothetical protein [Marinicella sediminis]